MATIGSTIGPGNRIKADTLAVSPIPTWVTARTEKELNSLFSSMTVSEQP